MIRQVGTQVRLRLVVTDLDGTAVNSPTVTVVVTKPDDSTLTPAVTNTGADGVYTADVTADLPGLWRYTATTAGSVVSTQSDQFTVVAAARPLVASMEEFKAHLNRSDTTDDAELYTWLTVATDWVEGILGGPVAPLTFTERLEVQSGRFFPKRRPLVSVTSITPDLQSSLDSSTYIVDTDRHMVRMQYYTWAAQGWYTIVYRAGLSTVPERVKMAGLIVAAHLWQTQNGGGGLPIPGDANPNDPLTFAAGIGYAIPNRARDLMAESRLPKVA